MGDYIPTDTLNIHNCRPPLYHSFVAYGTEVQKRTGMHVQHTVEHEINQLSGMLYDTHTCTS